MSLHQESSRSADDGGGSSGGSTPPVSWRLLIRPAEVLVWLLIALAVIEIFLRAHGLVVHLFNVVLLFIFAAVIALSLTPLVDRLQRLPAFRRQRIVPVLLLYGLLLAVLAGGISLLVPAVVNEVRQLPMLISSAQEALNRLPFHPSLPSASSLVEGGVGPALGVLSGTVTGLVDVILIVVISIYLLTGGRELIATMRTLSGRHSHLFDFTLLAVGGTVANYVRGQLLMSLIIGGYTGAAMALLGVHYAIGLGLAAAVLEFLPIIGAPVAMVLATLVALFQSPLLAFEAALAGLFGHVIDAYILGPRVNARVVRLHPLVAMAALLLGAEIGGILGALFAVPIAAVVNIFLGAVYRSRRGEQPFSTAHDSTVGMASLPRLGDEIRQAERDGVPTSEPPPPTSGRSRSVEGRAPG